MNRVSRETRQLVNRRRTRDGVGRARRRDRQVVRVLGILRVLLDGGRPSVRDLAARFGVRRETVYRDLRVLEEVGYPLTGDDESGRMAGRPRLVPGVRVSAPPMALTRQELAALVWATKQTDDRQPFHGALATAIPKLQSLAGREGRLGSSL